MPSAREKLPVRLAPPNVRIGVSGLGGTLIGAWRCYGGQRDGAEHSSSSSPDFLGDAVYTDRKTVWTGQALPPLPSCPRGAGRNSSRTQVSDHVNRLRRPPLRGRKS